MVFKELVAVKNNISSFKPTIKSVRALDHIRTGFEYLNTVEVCMACHSEHVTSYWDGSYFFFTNFLSNLVCFHFYFNLALGKLWPILVDSFQPFRFSRIFMASFWIDVCY